MRLAFPQNRITTLAQAYCDENEEHSQCEQRFQELGDSLKRLKNPLIEKPELFRIARWKSPRSAGCVDRNCDEFVREVTLVALSTPCERLRIESLTLLDGVSWPTASVILHFFHRDPYPILDYRALESLGEPEPNEYDFKFWLRYVETCRRLSQQARVDMRTLDRALWQYSWQNSKRNPSVRR